MGLPSFARYAGYSYMDSTRGGTQTRRAPEQHGAEPGPPDLGTVPLKQKKLEWATHTFEWDHAPNSARTLLHQSRLGNLLKLET